MASPPPGVAMSIAIPQADDIWENTTSKHNGQRWRVTKVTRNTVHFQALRGKERGRKHAIDLPVFIRENRLLRREEWRVAVVPGGGVSPIDVAIASVEEGEPAVLAAPSSPEIDAAFPPDPDPDPDPSPDPSPDPEPRPRRHGGGRNPSGRDAQLTDREVRDIWELAHDGIPYDDIAQEYRVSPSYVRKVHYAHSRRSVTAPLREAHGLYASAPPPRPTIPEETAPMAPQDPDTSHLKRTAYGRHFDPHPQRQAPSGGLLSELADAVEFLLDHAGRPLPRFLHIDREGIQALVERARDVPTPRAPSESGSREVHPTARAV